MIDKTNARGGVSAPVPIIKTVSGSVISISDALAQAAESLVVDINAVQSGSGDPSPSNVRPISGWSNVKVTRTGKNLLNPSYRSNLTQNVRFYYGTGILLKANTAYTFSVSSTSAQNAIYKIGGGNLATNYGKDSLTYTPPNDVNVWIDVYYAGNYPAPGGGTASVDCQLELGLTATDYEPYNGNTYTIQLGQTVYGGSLDATTGVLTVDSAMVDLGTLSWIYRSNLGGFSAPLTPLGKDRFNAICSAYPYGGAHSDLQDKMCGYVYNNQAFVKDSDYTDATTFKTAMSGVQLVYELATQQTVQLTPTEVQMLLGNNVLWADSGDSELQYWARR